MQEIKVFLVEDEIIIRNSIKNSINWEKEGYQFVGEASDGELAYPMILKEKPDILITDIKMPFMDGLELSSLVKTELPEIKILILSGYDDFEYAQKAIRTGVTEYLLKPVSSSRLLESLKEISQIIIQERQEKELLKRYSKEMQESIEHEKMKFFNRILMGEHSASEIIEEGKKYNMNFSAHCYEVMLFKILSNSEKSLHPELLIEAYERFEKMEADLNCFYLFQRGVDGWVFLFAAEDEQTMECNVQKVITEIQKIMKNMGGLEYFGGIGTPVARIRNLNESFRNADKAFSYRFTMESNQILSAGEQRERDENQDFQLKGFVEIGKSREMIEKFLNNGTIEEIECFSEAYIDRIKVEDFRSALVRQYIIMDIYIVIMSFCEKLSESHKDLQREADDLRNIIQNRSSLGEIRKYMTELLGKAIELRDTVSGRRYSDIIHAAKEEIGRLYMSEDISLNAVAVRVGMSPSYFSSVFSKEVGKTFVEYLTEVRMEKAKELIMCSSMKTSEIGYEVGYKDPHYFSYIFKKTQGCSPKEYRARRKE